MAENALFMLAKYFRACQPEAIKRAVTGPAHSTDEEDVDFLFGQDYQMPEDLEPDDDDWDYFLMYELPRHKSKLPMPVFVSPRQWSQPMRIMVGHHYGHKFVPSKRSTALYSFSLRTLGRLP